MIKGARHAGGWRHERSKAKGAERPEQQAEGDQATEDDAERRTKEQQNPLSFQRP